VGTIGAFHKEFKIFAIERRYRNQEQMLYDAFNLLKEKKQGEPQ
jgi:hypothetical protein